MGSIRKAFKKILKISGGGHNSVQEAAPTPAPELGVVKENMAATTEVESEKQQLTKGKKRGKKSLKVNMPGSSGAGRNIV